MFSGLDIDRVLSTNQAAHTSVSCQRTGHAIHAAPFKLLSLVSGASTQQRWHRRKASQISATKGSGAGRKRYARDARKQKARTRSPLSCYGPHQDPLTDIAPAVGKHVPHEADVG